MPSAAETAVAAGLTAMIDAAGVEITYYAGEASITLWAAVGRTEFTADAGAAGAVIAESRDYLILAADLSAGGAAVEPEPGHRIVEAGGQTYEVLPLEQLACWRWTDPYRLGRRIHTKEIANV